MENTTPETASKRTHQTFKSAEVLEDIAKVNDINAAVAEDRFHELRDKAAGYRRLAYVAKRFGGTAYPSVKPAGWEVTVLVDGLPKRGSGKTLIDAVRDLETRLPAEAMAVEVVT